MSTMLLLIVEVYLWCMVIMLCSAFIYSIFKVGWDSLFKDKIIHVNRDEAKDIKELSELQELKNE